MSNIIYGSVWFLTEFLKLYLVSFYLFGFEKSERIKEFVEILEGHHIAVAVRKSRGQDIEAACGQLKRRNHEKTQNQEINQTDKKES